MNTTTAHRQQMAKQHRIHELTGGLLGIAPETDQPPVTFPNPNTTATSAVVAKRRAANKRARAQRRINRRRAA